MKKIIVILWTTISVITLKSQPQTFPQMFDNVLHYVSNADATTTENVMGVSQKLDTTPVANSIKAISYKLILEYCFSYGIEHYYFKGQYIEEMKIAYNLVGLSFTAINNIAFKNRFLLGAGIGLELRNRFIFFPAEIGAVCFLNFRYYFKKSKKNLIPMLNMAIGARMVREYYIFSGKGERFSEMMYGAYATFGAGFKFRRLSGQAGLLFWTKGSNSYNVSVMVKVGVNF